MSIEFSLMTRCFLTLHVCVTVDYAGLSPLSTQAPAKEEVILLGAKSHLIIKHGVLTTHLSALLNSACRALSQRLLIHGDCLASLEIMISVPDKLLGPFRSRAGHKCTNATGCGGFLCHVLTPLSLPGLLRGFRTVLLGVRLGVGGSEQGEFQPA